MTRSNWYNQHHQLSNWLELIALVFVLALTVGILTALAYWVAAA